ncbi:MAG: transglutaminase-like domain-containing protein [Myxococcales bacterium]|nr:transglutaminase-like domain-containing protein [Polyangiaceae bacterium]MDW8248343.1 transglutaminase-like domain-containing protein [Myxococcales bacterium]
MPRLPLISLLVLFTLSSVTSGAPRPGPSRITGSKHPVSKSKKVTKDRWVAATPERMAELAAARARSGKKGEALAALATLYTLAERAPAGLVRRHLEKLGDGQGPVAEQARWLAAALHPQPQQASLPGLVNQLAILGPFQDTSGRVKQADIREGEADAWANRTADYSWGVYEVRWRPVITPVTARGVPLDLYIAPRRESCSYVASRVTLPQDGPVEVHLAASGAARLLWDGQDLGVSEEIHERAIFDRIGARVEATAGDHLVAARICAGSLDDAGRVRLRIQGPRGQEVKIQSSRDLTPLQGKTFGKVRFKALIEPLTEALALSSKPSVEEALASAVLRRLAGVDDLRSPRAPGLIDTVARSKDLPSDRLAMAGWVSAFGAARSGWLGQARERALAEGDEETADFAARRLAAARLEAGFIDWAEAALRSKPTADATDQEARLLRALARAGDGNSEGSLRAALAMLLEQASKGGSIAMWQEVARLARSFDANVELQARDELARLAPERFDLPWLHAATARDANSLTRAAASTLELGGLTNGSELATVGVLLMSAGRNLDARRFLGVAAQLAPNLSAVQQAFSQALFASGRPEDQELGLLALERARALQPGDARLRAEVALRGQQTQRKPLRDERWLVGPEKLLAHARATPARPGEEVDRQVYWMRAVTQHEDQRVSQLIQYGREIVIPPRQQEELYENLPMEGEEHEILRARVHRASGEVVFAEEAKSDQERPMIRWPDLKTGDVVEVVVRSWTSGPIGRRGDPPFYFLDYGGSVKTHPLLFNHVILDLPKERPLAVDLLNGKADRVESKEEGNRVITQYIWDQPVILQDEPLAPKPSEVFPTLVVSSFATWDEFRTWYQRAVAGFTEPDEQVKQIAAELTRGKTTREEKLKALFEFVADDIRYVNYISGEWWLPNRPQQLLARRQGDCDDKAILLITLLKAVGIEATEVLIQTRQTAQPSLLLSKKVAIPLFDHGIAYLPAKDGQPAMWLDATSPQSRLGPLPSMDARTYALFVNEGPAQMIPTPRSKPEEHGSDAAWELRLDANGGATLAATEVHRGDHAFHLRTALREPDARAQWVEQNLIGGWLPQAQVEPEIGFKSDLPRGEVQVSYRARTMALGRAEGQDLVVTLAPPTTLTSQLAPLPRRTLPVVLPPNLAPSRTERRVLILAPQGMRVGALPPGGIAAGGDFGSARLDVEVQQDGRAVLIQRSVIFDRDQIPVDSYHAWRSWLTQVDALLQRSVRFVPAR